MFVCVKHTFMYLANHDFLTAICNKFAMHLRGDIYQVLESENIIFNIFRFKLSNSSSECPSFLGVQVHFLISRLSFDTYPAFNSIFTSSDVALYCGGTVDFLAIGFIRFALQLGHIDQRFQSVGKAYHSVS